MKGKVNSSTLFLVFLETLTHRLNLAAKVNLSSQYNVVIDQFLQKFFTGFFLTLDM